MDTNPTQAEPAAPKRTRFHTQKFQTFEDAKKFQMDAKRVADGMAKNLCKAKVFARYDGTYDVALYTDAQRAKEAQAEAEEVLKKGIEAAKKVHGLKSKDRKKKR